MSTGISEVQSAAPKTLKQHLASDAMQRQIAMVVPKHVTAERMVRVALTALTRTPKLMNSTEASFFKCLLDCAQWGIEPDGRRAHLIPFDTNKKVRNAETGKEEWIKVTECTLIIDYKGFAELAYRSGLVRKIHAMEVREGDIFEYDCGEVKKHIPHFLRRDAAKPAKAGEIYAYYCRVHMEGDVIKSEVMSVDEVNAIRDKSQGYQAAKKFNKQSPWTEYPVEMGKKGLAVDTPIPTPSGWSTMGDLQVGDTVFDMHGKPTKVLAVSEIKHIDCFRLKFADGESITCDDEHRWVARIDGVGRPEWPVHTVNELFAAKEAGLPVSLPVAGSLSLDDVDLAIDPWLLGYWIGNGRADAASLTCDSADVEHVAASISQFTVGTRRADVRSRGVAIGVTNGFKVALRASRLLANKHIPAEYLRASHSQRLRLLQGLMDSDGHISKERGKAIFEQTSEVIAGQVCELLSSLGEKFSLKKYVRQGYGVTAETYRIAWQPINCPVTMPRKVANFRGRKLGSYRGVDSIVRTVTVPTKCIAVDSPTETYLAGKSMIPTHNTVFKRCSKWLPLTAEFRAVIDRDNEDYEPRVETTHTMDSLGSLITDDAPLLLEDEKTINQGPHIEEDSQLSPFDQATAEINAATSPITCKSAYDKWKTEFTDGEAADLAGLYEDKLKTFPTEKKKGGGQLPLNG